ncbi:MAG TPA: hypothetical protein VE934_09275 [Polaromonas sp.]|nr:hypothetical protein [Polaromonas sp.]
MRVAQLDITDWKEAVGKKVLSEASLLRIINDRLTRPSRHHGLMVRSLRPAASAEGNWTVGLFDLGCGGHHEQNKRLALLAGVLAAAGECYDVAWPSLRLH